MSLAAPAGAQTSLDAEISRGVALRRGGRDAAALRVFQAAWQSSRAPRALAQVALAEQALGRWVAAEAHLVEALGSTRDPWVRAHLAILQSALMEIRQHVGRLDVVGEPAGAEVVIGGEVVGTLPLSTMLRVPTGSLTFIVRREGYIPVTRTVQVATGYPLREQVALARVAVSTTTPPRVSATPPDRAIDRPTDWPTDRPTDRPAERLLPEPGTPTLRYVGYGMIGAGAAALAVSGVFLGINLAASGEAGSATVTSAEPYGAWARFQASENGAQQQTGAAQCDLAQQRQDHPDAAQVRDLCSRLSTSATAALVTGIAGGALLVTGVVFAVVARPGRAAAAASRWSLSPWIAANARGASLSGSW